MVFTKKEEKSVGWEVGKKVETFKTDHNIHGQCAYMLMK